MSVQCRSMSVQMSVQTHPVGPNVGPNVGPTSPCRSRSHPKSVQCRSRCRSRPAMSVQTSFPVILVSLTSCMSVSGHVICLSLYPGHHNSPLLKFRHLPLMTSSSLRENDTSQCSMTYLVSKWIKYETFKTRIFWNFLLSFHFNIFDSPNIKFGIKSLPI